MAFSEISSPLNRSAENRPVSGRWMGADGRCMLIVGDTAGTKDGAFHDSFRSGYRRGAGYPGSQSGSIIPDAFVQILPRALLKRIMDWLVPPQRALLSRRVLSRQIDYLYLDVPFTPIPGSP
jgi:hypothetical protein